MQKIKAAVRRNYGFPKEIKIEEIEKPIPNDNELLIKVYATTVNRTDCANLTAKPNRQTIYNALCIRVF